MATPSDLNTIPPAIIPPPTPPALVAVRYSENFEKLGQSQSLDSTATTKLNEI